MEANANNDFATTLAEALDKAAATDHGLTFFNGRGELANHTSYRDLRERALRTARRFLQLGLEKGDGVAIVAETRVEFAVLFFACQYAGLTPIPLTAIVSLGGRDNYVRQLSFLIENSGARAAFATDDFLEFLTAATEEIELAYVGSLPAFESDYKAEGDLPTITPDDLAYVQYTSGSTKVARGVLMTQRAIMCNLEAIVHDGLKLGPQDRFFSWLPFYHDMGLVGKLLTPIAGKVGVGYLCSRDFAQRPRLWLKLLHETKATVSFAPAFGYGLCARRLREGDGQKYDLSAWRIAGIGAEMIRTKTINAFTQAVAGSGFRPTSFLPCYGMAEVGLAISFSTQNEGVQVDHVDRNACMNSRQARALPKATADQPVQEFVECGKPLRGISIEIRDDQRNKLGDREIGTIWVQSNSVMSGYLKDPETTASTLVDGWLNTGDLGYVVDNRLVVTGPRQRQHHHQRAQLLAAGSGICGRAVPGRTQRRRHGLRRRFRLRRADRHAHPMPAARRRTQRGTASNDPRKGSF